MVKKAASKTTKKPTANKSLDTDGFGPSTITDEVVSYQTMIISISVFFLVFEIR